MKQFLSLFAALSFLVACGGADTAKNNSMGGAGMPPDDTQAGIEVDASKLVTVKDLVCGMSMKNVPITDTAVVNGMVYPFCAKVCKEKFLKNKDKYVVNE